MQRREVLRILATGTALQLAPNSMLAMLARARTEIGSQSIASSFNAHQEATMRVMTELILPRTETPGAADVGATEFINLMLTEWFDERDRVLFLSGLDGCRCSFQDSLRKVLRRRFTGPAVGNSDGARREDAARNDAQPTPVRERAAVR